MLQALDAWKAREKERQDAYAGVMDGLDASADGAADAPQFVAYVPLPDQKEIEQRVRAENSRARVRTLTLGSPRGLQWLVSFMRRHTTALGHHRLRCFRPTLSCLWAQTPSFPWQCLYLSMLALRCVVCGLGCV